MRSEHNNPFDSDEEDNAVDELGTVQPQPTLPGDPPHRAFGSLAFGDYQTPPTPHHSHGGRAAHQHHEPAFVVEIKDDEDASHSNGVLTPEQVNNALLDELTTASFHDETPKAPVVKSKTSDEANTVAFAKPDRHEIIKNLKDEELRDHPTKLEYVAELDFRAYKKADAQLEQTVKKVKDAKAEIDAVQIEVALLRKTVDDRRKRQAYLAKHPDPNAEIDTDLMQQENARTDAAIEENVNRIKKLKAFIKSQETPIEHEKIARKHALDKFTDNFGLRYKLIWTLKTAMLVDDIPFSIYQLLMGSATVSDFMKLFKKPPVSKAINEAVVLPPTLGDFFFNMLCFTPGSETESDLISRYEQYGSRGFYEAMEQDYAALEKRLAEESYLELGADAAKGLFNTGIKFTHNIFGAAANSYAIYATVLSQRPDIIEALGPNVWLIFSPMIALGICYYSILMNPKYDKGGEIIKQLATVVGHHLRDFDVTRSYIVFSRALLAATTLRALSFATISTQVKTIKPSPIEFIPDAVLQVTLLVVVAIHTLRARASTTYINMFDAKDKLKQEYKLSPNEIFKMTAELAGVLSNKQIAKNFLRNLLPSALSGGFFGVLGYYYSGKTFENKIDDQNALLGMQVTLGAALGLFMYQRYHTAMTQVMLENQLLGLLKYRNPENKVQLDATIIGPAQDDEYATNLERAFNAIATTFKENSIVFLAYLIAGLSAFSRTESGEYPTAAPLQDKDFLPDLVLVMGVTLLLGEMSFNSVQVFVDNILSSLKYHSEWMGKLFGCANDQLPVDYYMDDKPSTSKAVVVEVEDEEDFEPENPIIEPETLAIPQPGRIQMLSNSMHALFGSCFKERQQSSIKFMDRSKLLSSIDEGEEVAGAEMSSSNRSIGDTHSSSNRSIGAGPGRS